MKTIAKVLLIAMSSALMAAQCNVTQCPCARVVDKVSLAAGWCSLYVEDCEGVTTEYQVDEVEYNSYNVGDCYH